MFRLNVIFGTIYIDYKISIIYKNKYFFTKSISFFLDLVKSRNLNKKAYKYIKSCWMSPCNYPAIIRVMCPDIIATLKHYNTDHSEQLFWIYKDNNDILIDNRVLDRVIVKYNIDRKYYINAFKRAYPNYELKFYTGNLANNMYIK